MTPRPFRFSAPFAAYFAICLLALVAAAPVDSSDEARDIEVAPGTVVRWPGDSLESCRLGGREWAPYAGACWYAIDLLHDRGAVELARTAKGRAERALITVSDYIYPVQHITLQDDSRVNVSDVDLVRVRSEQKRVGSLWWTDAEPIFELPLAPPLEELPAGGRFGSRRFLNGQPRSPHSGADFAAPEGTPVMSAAGGRVVLSDDLFFSGESVFIDHGAGLVTMYFHLSTRQVEVGRQVDRGEVIGRVGQSGRATGPHLHFGVRWRGARVDPEILLGPAAAVPSLR